MAGLSPEQARQGLAHLDEIEKAVDAAERLIEAAQSALAAGGTVAIGPERARLSATVTAARLAFGLDAAPLFGGGDVEIPPAIAQLMAGIRRQFPAVTYDSRDPNRRAIEAAARAAHLVLVPSSTIQPRTIRGCDLPPGAR